MFGKKFKFSKKPLALTQNPAILIPMQTNTTNTNSVLPSNPVQLASTLTGKTIRYTNIKASSITENRERVFKIQSVEDISVSHSTGNEYVDVQLSDLDDNGAVKPRRLITSRISIVV